MIPPALPTTAQPVTDDTWLIPTLLASPVGGFIGIHSLVIRGREPVIVDTGPSLVREAWLERVFSVVDPSDVRWVFLSHDDHDHIGNLDVVLEMCPRATLVANFPLVGRLFGDVDLPLGRMRWLNPGETLDVGDRVLRTVRPPMFDSPATQGLFDPSSGVLWAVDSFGSLYPGEVHERADVPDDLYDETFAVLNSWNTPWLEWVDTERFTAHVDDTRSLPLQVVTSAHGPVLRGSHITDAYARTLNLAAQPPVPTPGQELLDQLVAAALAA